MGLRHSRVEGTVGLKGTLGLPLRAARIDTSAIVHNLQLLRNSAQTELIADVSADAYGHGAVAVARTLQDAGVHAFVVATVAQGVALRRGGIDAPIVAWLHPAAESFGAESFRAAAQHDITVAVSSPEQLAAAHTAGVSSVQLVAALGGNAVGSCDEHWGELIDTAVRFRNEGPGRHRHHGHRAAAHSGIPCRPGTDASGPA